MDDDYVRLSRLIRSRADEVGPGCSTEELDVVRGAFPALPAEYVAYLTDFGWFAVSSREVMGFGANVPARFDVIQIVTWERQQAYPPMSPALLPLENNGAGDHYCLDLRAPTNPVVFWSHDDRQGSDQVPPVVAATFVAWALDLFESHAL